MSSAPRTLARRRAGRKVAAGNASASVRTAASITTADSARFGSPDHKNHALAGLTDQTSRLVELSAGDWSTPWRPCHSRSRALGRRRAPRPDAWEARRVASERSALAPKANSTSELWRCTKFSRRRKNKTGNSSRTSPLSVTTTRALRRLVDRRHRQCLEECSVETVVVLRIE